MFEDTIKLDGLSSTEIFSHEVAAEVCTCVFYRKHA